MTAESKSSLKQVVASVAASLIVAGLVNFVAFTASFSKMSVRVDVLTERVDDLETDYDAHKKESGQVVSLIQQTLARIQETMSRMSEDMRDIKADHREMLQVLGRKAAAVEALRDAPQKRGAGR
jgi:outer membrane murein-binding lipoprotein Lpp